MGKSHSPGILLSHDPPVKGRQFMGAVTGPVLVHYIDIRVRRDFLSQKANDLGRACQVAGQDQMPYQQPSLGYAAIIQDQICLLYTSPSPRDRG